MTLEQLIRELLTHFLVTRKNDMLLMWAVWEKDGTVQNGVISKERWLRAQTTKPESIRRSRQKLQEVDITLRADETTQAIREAKEEIVREEVKKDSPDLSIFDYNKKWGVVDGQYF